MQDEQAASRAGALKTIIFIAIMVIAGRLWILQIISGTNLRRLAEGNRVRVIEESAARGSIVDRNNKQLVSNKKILVLTVTQNVIKKDKVLEKLSNIVKLPKKELINRINEQRIKLPPLVPRKIVQNINIEQATEIKENSVYLPGTDVIEEPIRNYSNGAAASHVLGYLGEISPEETKRDRYAEYSTAELVGKAGLERSYDSILRGQKGGRQVEVDAGGRPTRILSRRDSVPGHNIVLTLDLNIQKITEKALADAIKNARKQGMRHAKAGAAVVLDPNNGEVVAMASYPTYDPSLFNDGISQKEWSNLNAKKSNYPLNNRAIMAVYPPGSTFKIITALAALENKIISPINTFICKGKWTAFGKRWAKYCWERSGHGLVSLKRALVDSCDIYFYEVGNRFYKKNSEGIQEYARLLGIGTPTGIDLPWEKRGRVPDQEWKKEFNKNHPEYQKWLPGDTVNMSIGQGDVLATPLQIASTYGAMANGGTLYRPHIVKKIATHKQEIVRSIDPQVVRAITRKSYIRQIQRGLEGVIRDGTAKDAFSGFPIKIAGKTGTSQVTGKDDMAWFVGYGPLPNPKYVIAIVIEEGGHGGSVGAPAVRQIFGNIYNLPKNISNKSNAKDRSR